MDKTVSEIIEDVIYEICDSYCKFAEQIKDFDDLQREHCENCPLNKLA